MSRRPKAVDFEQALRELEAVVEKLEHGDLPLEESLRHFERGVALTRECQTALKAAEARIEILTRRRDAAAGEEATEDEAMEPFEPSGEQAEQP